MNPRQDALSLLTAEHADLMDMFESFGALCERGASKIEKSAVAEEICLSLTIHAQVEQEIFYPAVRAAIGDDALMDEAQVEHAEADDLNARISTMKPTEALFDARVIVLGAAFDRHVKTAQRKMFPKVRRSGIDLMALGARLQDRSDELLALYKEMLGRSDWEDESADPVGRPVTPFERKASATRA